MTAITPLRGTQLYIKVSNGDSPETFSHPCLINSKRGIKFTSDTGKVIVPDCDNPDDPAWKLCIKDGLQMSIDGAGVLDNKEATITTYDTWFRSPDPKNVQVWLGTLGYWAASLHLTGWEVNGDRGQNCEASISMESEGVVPAFLPA